MRSLVLTLVSTHTLIGTMSQTGLLTYRVISKLALAHIYVSHICVIIYLEKYLTHNYLMVNNDSHKDQFSMHENTSNDNLLNGNMINENKVW